MRPVVLWIILILPLNVWSWSETEVNEEVKIYRNELNQEFTDLRKQEKHLIRSIKIWKAQELKVLQEDRDEDLRLLEQEFSIKVSTLDTLQRYKTSKHQEIVEKTFIRSVELKEERFLRKREIINGHYLKVTEIEKEFMDKYHDIIKKFAKEKLAELNDRIPTFFPRLADIRGSSWLQKKYCQEQTFYKKQQALMDFKTYLFDLTVPMRKKREEAEALIDVTSEEKAFYQEALKMAKALDPNSELTQRFQKKNAEAQLQYQKSTANLKRLKKTIKQVAYNLKREKARKSFNCDLSQPIAQIQIKE